LGYTFLRHIARTSVLIHLIDLAAPEREPVADFHTVNDELRRYDPALQQRPMLVALNKVDLSEGRARAPGALAAIHALGYRAFLISGATGEGLDALMVAAADLLAVARHPVPDAAAGGGTADPMAGDGAGGSA
jgi:GTP-binding protein